MQMDEGVPGNKAGMVKWETSEWEGLNNPQPEISRCPSFLGTDCWLTHMDALVFNPHS